MSDSNSTTPIRTTPADLGFYEDGNAVAFEDSATGRYHNPDINSNTPSGLAVTSGTVRVVVELDLKTECADLVNVLESGALTPHGRAMLSAYLNMMARDPSLFSRVAVVDVVHAAPEEKGEGPKWYTFEFGNSITLRRVRTLTEEMETEVSGTVRVKADSLDAAKKIAENLSDDPTDWDEDEVELKWTEPHTDLDDDSSFLEDVADNASASEWTEYDSDTDSLSVREFNISVDTSELVVAPEPVEEN